MLSQVAKEYHDEAGELRALFEKQLKELYWAEQVMLDKLSKITADVYSKDLASILKFHKEETVVHVTRLEKIFKIAGIPPETKQYEGVVCLINEVEQIVQLTGRGVVRDAGLISVLQKIEHYEIACYGTMKAFAVALREEDAVTLLLDTLEEEKNADAALSQIAESHINTEAADKEI